MFMLVVRHKLTNDGSYAGNSHSHHLFSNVKYFNGPKNRTFSNISRIVTVSLRVGPRHIDATTNFIIMGPKQVNILAPPKETVFKVYRSTMLAEFLMVRT